MRVGITGHQRLDADAWPFVISELDRFFETQLTPFTGLSSLAEGADQVFAERVLAFEGQLMVVLPFPGYRGQLPRRAGEKFDELIVRATQVVTLDPVDDDLESSYLMAGKYIVEAADVMLAVWDGRPAAGKGGTADIVEYARICHKPVVVVDVRGWRRK